MEFPISFLGAEAAFLIEGDRLQFPTSNLNRVSCWIRNRRWRFIPEKGNDTGSGIRTNPSHVEFHLTTV
jgi:hypothetical protein